MSLLYAYLHRLLDGDFTYSEAKTIREPMATSATKPKTHRLPERGEVVGSRYQLGDEIASGGMGVVMRATDLSMEREVGIKLLHAHIASQEGFTERFKREVRLATLFNHPNITRVYDFGETDDGILFLVMELLDGEELKSVIKHQGPLTAGRTIDIGTEVLDGLAEAHSMEVVHRDLKPSNIFLSRTRRGKEVVKVLDFGVAKLLDSEDTTLTKTGMVAGTPSYMAPERLMGQGDHYAVDVYAVGLILLEMLLGKKVFDGETMAQSLLMQLKKPVPLPTRIAQTPLGDVIRKATLKHPDDRYRDAEKMLEALSGAARNTPRDLKLSSADVPPSLQDTSSSLLERIAGGSGDMNLLREMPQHESDFGGLDPETSTARELLNTLLIDEDDYASTQADDDTSASTLVEGKDAKTITDPITPVGGHGPFDGPSTRELRRAARDSDHDDRLDTTAEAHPTPAPAALVEKPPPMRPPSDDPAPASTSPDDSIDGAVSASHSSLHSAVEKVQTLLGAARRRWAWSYGAAGVGALIVVGVAVVLLTQPDDEPPAQPEPAPPASAPAKLPEFASTAPEADAGANDRPQGAPTQAIVIHSEPDGARVYDGSRLLGTTELTLELPPGEIPEKLRLEKADHEPTTVTLPDELEAPLEVTLQAKKRPKSSASTSRQPSRNRPKPRPTKSGSSNTDQRPASETEESPDEDDNASKDVDTMLDEYLPGP